MLPITLLWTYKKKAILPIFRKKKGRRDTSRSKKIECGM